MTTSISDNGVQFADGSIIESAAKLGLRNKIINGKMDIAQRGTSFAAIASGAYSLDRWLVSYSTTSVATVTQQSDVPSSNEFQSSLRFAVTTADSSIAAGDFAFIEQRIEGYNVRDLIGRTFTLSFWVRSSKTGTHCVSLRNSAADRSYISEYTINAANTWEFKTIAVSGGLITAGAWNWTNGSGIGVAFALAAGTTFQTTAGAWQTGNFLATANQVNCLDTIGNIFAITGVQLEVGSTATPFEHRPYGMELALCQRYTRGAPTNYAWPGQMYSTTGAAVFSTGVPMRGTPTLSTTSGFLLANGAGSNSVTGLSVLSNGVDGTVGLNVTVASGLTAGQATYMYQIPAGLVLSAEL